jgi:non-homologous end joining protein Ku
VLDMVKKKAEGEEITLSQTPPQQGKVIDLMEALKKSLGSTPKQRKPAVRAESGEPEKTRKKVQSSKK